MKKLLIYCFSFVFLSFFFLAFPAAARGASFSLEPGSASISKNNEFQVKLNILPGGKRVTSVQAVLNYPASLLELRSADFTSLFPSNFKKISQSEGKVTVSAGMDQPGTYVNQNSHWLTFTFKATGTGTANLGFVCGSCRILEAETSAELLTCGSLPTGVYTISEGGGSTPTATPTPSSSGGSGNGNGGGNGFSPPGPACTLSSPSAPTNIRATSGPNNGEVTLRWDKSSGTTHYGVVFGTSSKNYQYGAANIGNTDVYAVKSLAPGQLYYFAVVAFNNCAPSSFSAEVSAKAGGSAGTGTPKPTPTIYVPIEQILPQIASPTPTFAPYEEEIEITPAPVEEGTGLTLRKLLLPAIIVLIFLLVLVLLLTRRGGGSLPPPVSPTSPQQGEAPVGGQSEGSLPIEETPEMPPAPGIGTEI